MKKTIFTSLVLVMIVLSGCSIDKDKSAENQPINNKDNSVFQVIEKTIAEEGEYTKCKNLVEETLPLEELDVIIMEYFKNPQPQKIVPLINTISNHQIFEKNKQMTWFFAEIFKQHPQYINSWIMKDLCGLNEDKTNEWDALVTALWISKTKEGETVLQEIQKKSSISGKKFINELYERDVNKMDPLKQNISSPLQLDIFWASFFASGKSIYVEKIIKTMLQNKENILLSSAAEWSLSANSKQFIEVKEILEKYSLNSNDQEEKTVIENILK
ncbi:hypothetical protein K8R62_01640 [bacterium]|nr:hypothetical protein [bacterium]